MKDTKVRTEITSTDKKTGHTTLHGERRTSLKNSETSLPTAMIKVSNGITLSLNYQSVRMDIGVEMPWPVRAGEFKDLNDGFAQAYEVIENELAERAGELDSLLKDLAKKY